MKKTLIATAIAGAMGFAATAQAAEVDVYGSLRVKAESAKDQSLEIKDNSSRIGIKASTDLDGGLKGMAHFETQVDTVSGSIGSASYDSAEDELSVGGRLAYIGVTGDFGTVTAGRQWTPQYLWTSAKVDILDVGSNPTHSYTFAGRQGNTLAYISPDMGGLQLAGVVISAGGASNDPDEGDDFDAYNFAANYKMGGLSVGASTIIVNNGVDKNYSSVAVSYEAGPAYVAVEASSNELANNLAGEDTYEVAASYQVVENAKVLANFVGFEDGTQIAVEGQYQLGAESRVALTVVTADTDAEAAGYSSDTVAASWRVDF